MRNYLVAALFICMIIAPGGSKAHANELPSDTWMQSRIDAEYQLSDILSPFDIDAHVQDGVAELSGVVANRRQKELAENIARHVRGIEGVLNRIEIDAENADTFKEGKPVTKNGDSYSQKIDDFSTTARILAQLQLAAPMPGSSIDVDTRSTQIYLSGEVESAEDRQLVERIAKILSGNRGVSNRLTIAKEIS